MLTVGVARKETLPLDGFALFALTEWDFLAKPAFLQGSPRRAKSTAVSVSCSPAQPPQAGAIHGVDKAKAVDRASCRQTVSFGPAGGRGPLPECPDHHWRPRSKGRTPQLIAFRPELPIDDA